MNFVEFQVGLMMGATAEEQVSLMIWFPLLPFLPLFVNYTMKVIFVTVTLYSKINSTTRTLVLTSAAQYFSPKWSHVLST